MMINVVHYSHPSDVYDDGLNYVYNMMLDYEKIVVEHETLTITDFLKEWNVIPREAFGKLDVGDIVYDCVGNAYTIIESPWEDDQNDVYVTNVYEVKSDGSLNNKFEQTFSSGDLYYSPHYHDWAFLKSKKTKGDSKRLCPILITNQVQPQS